MKEIFMHYWIISKNLIFSNSSEAIIIGEESSKGVILRGYLKNDFSNLEVINNKKFEGKNIKLDQNLISIGRELSFNLDLQIGDSISIMSSSGIETIIGNLPKQKTFIISSIFESGLVDFDNNVIFLNLETLEEFSNLQKKDRNLEIYLNNPQKIKGTVLPFIMILLTFVISIGLSSSQMPDEYVDVLPTIKTIKKIQHDFETNQNKAK